MKISKARFFMVDRILEETDINSYRIYQFIKKNMSIELRHRKLNEFYTIQHIFRNTNISVVIYDQNNNFRIERWRTPADKLIKTKDEPYNFAEYQKIFCDENNSNAQGSSKPLGDEKDSDDDKSVTELLQELTGNKTFAKDDEGVDVTEKLLNGVPTRGFDADLFDAKEGIVYEFLRRKSPYTTNLKTHPMRYTWTTGEKKDNRQKFISLWDFCTHYNLKLVLVNYSRNEEDSDIIKLIFPKDIDRKVGFLGDEEFALKKNDFVEYLKNANRKYLLNYSIGNLEIKPEDYRTKVYRTKDGKPEYIYIQKLNKWSNKINGKS